ncbi:hypothetical protein ABN254_21550 [Providencia rettgeri]
MGKGSMGDNILFERVQIKFKVIRRKQKMKNGHEYFIQERWAQDSGKNIKSSMKTKLFSHHARHHTGIMELEYFMEDFKWDFRSS